MCVEKMISVIIPLYNAGDLISRCIESLLRQSYLDFELLLINDGSSDSSGQICDEYAKNDLRIRVFHKINGGVSSARNLGLKQAKGEWIVFVDADDWVLEDYLKDLYSGIVSGKTGLVVHGFIFPKSNGDEITSYPESLCYDNFVEALVKNGLHRCGYVYSRLYHKDTIIEKSLFFDENIHFGEDQLFILSYFFSGIDYIHFMPNANYNRIVLKDGLNTKYYSFEKEYSLFRNYLSEVVKIDELCKGESKNEGMNKLYERASFFLMRAISSLYRPTGISNKRKRILILKNVYAESIGLAKEYNKYNFFLYDMMNFMFVRRWFCLLDGMCSVVFKLRHKFNSTWLKIR